MKLTLPKSTFNVKVTDDISSYWSMSSTLANEKAECVEKEFNDLICLGWLRGLRYVINI